MNQAPLPGVSRISSRGLQRRELMTLAAGAAGAVAAGPAAAARFDEPATADAYLSTMRLGSQAGDYLEMPYEPAGLRNQLRAADFDVMRKEARLDHVRIPANSAVRADGDGVVPEDFLRKLDEQVSLSLERFERVVLDPLHHYLQWKGNHGMDRLQSDGARVNAMTAEQHAVRATAMWVQIAERYKDQSLRLSFDLVNEPSGRKAENFPDGMTFGQLNAWYAAVIPAIRATGGKNAQRMLWLEPYDNMLELLALPAGAGPVGVSPHYYSPFQFTHRSGSLTAAGMASYVEDIQYARRWGERNRLPIWIGEAGVSRNLNVGQVPRPAEDRAEYVAHLRNTALQLEVPVCFWGYNSHFGQYDQASRQWLPGMRQALTGLPAPLPVREIPSFTELKGGRLLPGSWPGFSYDPATGLLTAQDNSKGPDRPVQLLFPEIPVASDQQWFSRAVEFTGFWMVGTAPFVPDPRGRDAQGRSVGDRRASNATGRGIYPAWRPGAPGGMENPYGTISEAQAVFGIDAVLRAGSPAGSIRFSCLRSA